VSAPPGYNYLADLAFAVGLFAGWLAFVIAITWQDVHCRCCAKRTEKGGKK
jgi:hypothetical protein